MYVFNVFSSEICVFVSFDNTYILSIFETFISTFAMQQWLIVLPEYSEYFIHCIKGLWEYEK